LGTSAVSTLPEEMKVTSNPTSTIPVRPGRPSVNPQLSAIASTIGTMISTRPMLDGIRNISSSAARATPERIAR